MDLLTLGVIIATGLPLVLLLAHLSGASGTTQLGSDAHIAETWALDDERAVAAIQRSDDNVAALLTLDDQSYGLVFALGDRFVCRALDPVVLHRVIERADQLVLNFGDVGAPRVSLRMADPGTRAGWLQRLETR